MTQNSDDANSVGARALAAIRQLQAELSLVDQAAREPIAIVGASCRFPGAPSLDAYWKLLSEGVDATSDVPADRWKLDPFYDPEPGTPRTSITHRGAFLRDVDQFDAGFFEISRREAEAMDPQQRMVLEVGYEAVADAAIPVARRDVGVFIGATTWDYNRRGTLDVPSDVAPYIAIGGVHCIIANRLSYALGLRGPSFTIDSACSASLAALHLACESLRRKECEAAIAGGVHLMTSPETFVFYSKAAMLAPDGRCKTFDARANGFGRGEGCGLVVLKRLSDAVASGDRIYATIRASAVNQDGKTSGLSAPSPLAQERVIRAALAAGRIDADRVAYIEAHGTGTSLGDPIEIEGLTRAHGKRTNPCAIGSAKTNIGHLEAAAGIAGLLKSVLAIRHRQIPASLHFETPNPHIDFASIPFRVQTKTGPWPAWATELIAGVSSFGIGGTNAHVIVGEAPATSAKATAPSTHEARSEALVVTAKSESALRAYAASLAKALEPGPEGNPLLDVCVTASRREPMAHRLTVVGSSAAEVASTLDTFARTGRAPAALVDSTCEAIPETVFVYSGQGPQWWRMGRELYEREAVFRESVDAIDALVRTHAGWSLFAELAKDEATSRLASTEIAQPALFAIHVALTALLASWGVRPSAVAGHSVGEIAAAHVSGALSLEHAVRLVIARGRIMQRATGLGKMAHVGMPARDVEPLVAEDHRRIDVAAANGPNASVIAGDASALEPILQKLAARGVETKYLPVDYAFHAPQLDPLVSELERELAFLRPSDNALPFYSTADGAERDGQTLDAAYWGRQIRARVRFRDAVKALLDDGKEVFVEIGPHPVLQSYLADMITESGKRGRVIATLDRRREERAAVLETLGVLHNVGIAVDWKATQGPGGRVVSLPHYPWQKQRYWIEDAPANAPTTRGEHPLLDRYIAPADAHGVHLFSTELSLERHPYLRDHVVGGLVVVPGAFHIAMAIAGARRAFGDGALGVADVTFPHVLDLTGPPREVQLAIEPGRTRPRFRVQSREQGRGHGWELHAEGEIAIASPPTTTLAPASLASIREAAPSAMPAAALYGWLASRAAITLGSAFQVLTDVSVGATTTLARLAPAEPVAVDLAAFGLHPAMVDAYFQVSGALLRERNAAPFLPARVEAFHVHGRPERARWVSSTVRHEGPSGTLETDHVILDEEGRVLVEIRGLALDPVGRAAAAFEHAVAWRELGKQAPLDAKAHPSQDGTWLVLADADVGPALSQRIARWARRCITIRAGTGFAALGHDLFAVDAGSPGDLTTVLETALAPNETLAGVVHLWTLDARSTDASGLENGLRLGAGGALAILGALAARRATPRLWLVTRGAHHVGVTERTSDDIAIAQRSLWGFAATAMQEASELHPSIVDLDPAASPTVSAEVLHTEIGAADDEARVALRGGTRFGARIAPARRTETEPVAFEISRDRGYRLDVESPGRLDSLRLVAATAPSAPATGEVTIRVHAACVLARDARTATSSTTLGTGGTDCAGIVVAVGAGVDTLRVGDRVLAYADRAFASHVTAQADLVVPIPTTLGFDEAATIPTAYLTAAYALDVARVREGETVLVHATTASVRRALVHWARLRGVDVVTTESGGRRVDVIVHELEGETPWSGAEHLAPFGRYVALSSNGGRSALRSALDELADNATLSFVSVEKLTKQRPREAGKHLRDVVEVIGAEGGERLRTSTVTRFAADEAPRAFTTALAPDGAAAVVLTMGDRTRVVDRGTALRDDASYLVTGGLGGLGLLAAGWLVDRGARHVVLAGRSAPSPDAEAVIARLRAAGANVTIENVDVSDAAVVSALVTRIDARATLRGIIHAAGALEDATLATLTPAQLLGAVFGAKVRGALHLAGACRGRELDLFVLYSSAAAVFGSPGQANYGAANALLDAIAERLRAQGMPAVSIGWGPWGEAGMAARVESSARRAQGFVDLTSHQGIELLGRAVTGSSASVLAVNVDLARWAGALGPSTPKLVDGVPGTSVVGHVGSAAAPASATSLRDELLNAAPETRATRLQSYLAEVCSTLLRVDPQTIGPTTPLGTYGFDSLMVMSLRNRLRADLAFVMTPATFFAHPTVDKLTSMLITWLQESAVPKTTEIQPEHLAEVRAADSAEEAPELDDEAARLLEATLAELEKSP